MVLHSQGSASCPPLIRPLSIMNTHSLPARTALRDNISRMFHRWRLCFIPRMPHSVIYNAWSVQASTSRYLPPVPSTCPATSPKKVTWPTEPTRDSDVNALFFVVEIQVSHMCGSGTLLAFAVSIQCCDTGKE
jgi:hypothetical protein